MDCIESKQVNNKANSCTHVGGETILIVHRYESKINIIGSNQYNRKIRQGILNVICSYEMKDNTDSNYKNGKNNRNVIGNMND